MKKDRKLLIAKQTLPLIKQYALQNNKGYINNIEVKIKEQRINDGVNAIEELINNYNELYQLTEHLDKALNLAVKDLCILQNQPNSYLNMKENYINQAKEKTNDTRKII